MDIDEANSLILDNITENEEINIFIVGDEKIDKTTLIYNLNRQFNVNFKTEKFLGKGIKYFEDLETKNQTERTKHNFIEINSNVDQRDICELKHLAEERNILCFVFKKISTEVVDRLYTDLSFLNFEKIIIVLLDKRGKPIKRKLKFLMSIYYFLFRFYNFEYKHK
jgi:hypothetical protein